MHWRACTRDMFNALLLNPRMTVKYELKLASLLEYALRSLDYIENVRYVSCSFPSVASEAPRLALRRWAALDESEWNVTFAPASWRIEISLEGRQVCAASPFRPLAYRIFPLSSILRPVLSSPASPRSSPSPRPCFCRLLLPALPPRRCLFLLSSASFLCHPPNFRSCLSSFWFASLRCT